MTLTFWLQLGNIFHNTWLKWWVVSVWPELICELLVYLQPVIHPHSCFHLLPPLRNVWMWPDKNTMNQKLNIKGIFHLITNKDSGFSKNRSRGWEEGGGKRGSAQTSPGTCWVFFLQGDYRSFQGDWEDKKLIAVKINLMSVKTNKQDVALRLTYVLDRLGYCRGVK